MSQIRRDQNQSASRIRTSGSQSYLNFSSVRLNNTFLGWRDMMIKLTCTSRSCSAIKLHIVLARYLDRWEAMVTSFRLVVIRHDHCCLSHYNLCNPTQFITVLSSKPQISTSTEYRQHANSELFPELNSSSWRVIRKPPPLKPRAITCNNNVVRTVNMF